MASTPISGDAAPVTLPGTIPPMPAVARILARFDRPTLESFLSVAIDLLDVMAGDPEAEESDPAESDGDSPDIAWTEWHQRGRHKLAGGKAEMLNDCPWTGHPSEDDEPDGDEADGNGAEDEPCGWFALYGSGPGCDIADAGERTEPLIPEYGIDQTDGPNGQTIADQVHRWNALPTVPPIYRGNSPQAT